MQYDLCPIDKIVYRYFEQFASQNHNDNTNLYTIYGLDPVNKLSEQIEINKNVVIQALEKYKNKILADFDDESTDLNKK